MLVSKMTDKIKIYEGFLAYGSETVLWDYYVDRIYALCGCSPTSDAAYAATISRGETAWWLRSYRALSLMGDVSFDQVCDSIV